jgi:dihydrofolate reductase
MLIALIAAMDRNRLIGDGDRLPWRLPADLRRFRALTMGKPIVMGRRTHESIGKALPGRHNIVLSRSADFKAPNCVVVTDWQQAVREAGDAPELMVIGGAQLYAEALPRAERMYLTLLHSSFTGDTWFPEYDAGDWREVSREDHPRDEESPCAYSFVDLERT